MRGSHFDRRGQDGGGIVFRWFGAAVAHEGLDEVEHYWAGAVMIPVHEWYYRRLGYLWVIAFCKIVKLSYIRDSLTQTTRNFLLEFRVEMWLLERTRIERRADSWGKMILGFLCFLEL